jgi:DHA3 family macrolide efflux protein-like MFS transporter
MARRVTLLTPLRDRAIALLWGGLATSALGDQLFAVVLTWVAVGLLGTDAGYLAAMQAAAGLAVALFAGPWADRFDQRRLMLGADLCRAAILLALMAIWLRLGGPPLWSLFAAVLVLASGQSLFRPAMQALLPELVADPQHLPATNALLDTTDRIARLLGPGAIGLASALLPLAQFVTLDALTFLASAAAVLAVIRLRPMAPLVPGVGRLAGGWLRGFRAVRRHPLLGFMLGASAVINGAWYTVIFVGLPLMIRTADATLPGGSNRGLAEYGLVISAYGAANLLSNLVVGSQGIATRPARLIFSGNLILGLGMAGMGLAGALLPGASLLPALLACSGLAAIGGPMQDITMATLRQTVLPLPDMAAAVRAYMVMNALGMLLALLCAPWMFDALGVPRAILLCGLAVALVGVVGLLRHGERRRDQTQPG